MDTSTAQNLGILWISGPTYRRFISSILTYVIDIPPIFVFYEFYGPVRGCEVGRVADGLLLGLYESS